MAGGVLGGAAMTVPRAGFTLGVMLRPLEPLQIGLVYRSGLRTNVSGNGNVEDPAQLLVTLAEQSARPSQSRGLRRLEAGLGMGHRGAAGVQDQDIGLDEPEIGIRQTTSDVVPLDAWIVEPVEVVHTRHGVSLLK